MPKAKHTRSPVTEQAPPEVTVMLIQLEGALTFVIVSQPLVKVVVASSKQLPPQVVDADTHLSASRPNLERAKH